MLTSNCYLLGFMGAGKSYMAKRLSQHTQLPMLDLDRLIEVEAGKSIPQIFNEEGEAHFRVLEAQLLRSSSGGSPKIIALGGGTPVHHQNMAWIKENGHSIFLDPPTTILLERLQKGAAQRPLVAQLSPEVFEDQIVERLEKRRPFYEQADYHIGQHAEASVLAACIRCLSL
jgi:shikimate kinase